MTAAHTGGTDPAVLTEPAALGLTAPGVPVDLAPLKHT